MLQSYSARKHFQNQIKDEKPEVVSTISSLFDVTTPEGAFFAQVHKNGFAMYEIVYNLKEEYRFCPEEIEHFTEEQNAEYEASLKLTEEKYNWLSDEDKTHYEKSVEYTELYNALKVSGNQEIVATAGSGKTTMMIFKIQHDIVTGEATHLQTVPTGAQVRVVNKKNGKEVIVDVRDRGPFAKGRVIDLSNKAAELLGMLSDGVVPVELWVVEPKN